MTNQYYCESECLKRYMKIRCKVALSVYSLYLVMDNGYRSSSLERKVSKYRRSVFNSIISVPESFESELLAFLNLDVNRLETFERYLTLIF